MSRTVIPAGYRPAEGLGLYDTQAAINEIHSRFAAHLCGALHLTRASAPLFVDPKTGLNDDLNGVERPVSFDIKETGKIA
ncbi:MAG: aspartate--ammonia ligase, partial [Anaerotruncus colihominis]